MAMKRSGSILWILFLLAALVVGPAVMLRRTAVAVEHPTLSETIAQEQLLDAPADLKGSVPTAPSADESAVLE